MPSGGARVRSGPPPSAESNRSDSRGLQFVELPAKTRKRKPPKWPLATPQRFAEEYKWERLWRLPQATAWRMPKYSYMLDQLALYTRIAVDCESPEVQPSMITQMLRMQDQLGLSEAGMQRLQWRIVEKQSGRRKTDVKSRPRRKSKSRARLEVINGGDNS